MAHSAIFLITKEIVIYYYYMIGSEKMEKFELHSKYTPQGDQPQAIEKLVQGIKEGKKSQVVLGDIN